MDENWVPIPGYEGAYEVSDAGRVRSVSRVVVRGNGRTHTVVGKIRSTKLMKKGHLAVTLILNGSLQTHTVHKLVLVAFVGRPSDPAMMCRHLNGDPSDNRLGNLRWGTASENQIDAVQHGAHYLAKKQTCPRGHALTNGNLAKSTRRVCLACKREHDQARHEGRAFCVDRADARYQDVLNGVVRHKSENRF